MVVALKTKRRVGSRVVELSSLDKVLFPDGITKGELIDYYDAVAPRLLPHLKDRPLVMERFPDGIERGGFFQKQASAHVPDWVQQVRVKKEGGTQSLVVCNDRATLVYLANQAAIVLHPWLSCGARIREPDKLVLDLDPPSDDFRVIRDAARNARALFDELGMPVFLKTSGSRGLHLVVPLAGGEDFDVVRDVAARIADELARRHPEALTVDERPSAGNASISTSRGTLTRRPPSRRTRCARCRAHPCRPRSTGTSSRPVRSGRGRSRSATFCSAMIRGQGGGAGSAPRARSKTS